MKRKSQVHAELESGREPAPFSVLQLLHSPLLVPLAGPHCTVLAWSPHLPYSLDSFLGIE